MDKCLCRTTPPMLAADITRIRAETADALGANARFCAISVQECFINRGEADTLLQRSFLLSCWVFPRLPPLNNVSSASGFMSQVNLYHIAYSQETLEGVPSGYSVLNNLNSERNDWREYWPIRNFLLSEALDEASYYGFFSPRFQEKTGLSHAQVTDFVLSAGSETDVVIFCPQPDMGAFFLNIFEQEELFQPGFTAASEAFLETVGISVQLGSLVMDSRQIIFSSYFVARPKFWRDWLTFNEKLFAVCEGEESELKNALVQGTIYPGSVQRKVFLMERMASLLLTLFPGWKVCAYDTFDCAWSASRLNQFKLEAVLSDALKIAMKEQGFHDYQDAFATLRDRLR